MERELTIDGPAPASMSRANSAGKAVANGK